MVSSDNFWGNTGCWFTDDHHHSNRMPAAGKVSILHISAIVRNVHSAGRCAEQPMQHFSGGTEQGMEASWWQQHLLVQLRCAKQILFTILQHPMLTSDSQSMSFQRLSCVLCASSAWSLTIFSRYFVQLFNVVAALSNYPQGVSFFYKRTALNGTACACSVGPAVRFVASLPMRAAPATCQMTVGQYLYLLRRFFTPGRLLVQC